jgi:enoyl-CoA hydratase/carnithine racemase
MKQIWPNDVGQPPAILAETREGVAIVTLSRPSKLNAWTPAMGSLYFDTLDRLAADTSVRAILVVGEGRGFCAGADMRGLENLASSGVSEPVRDPRRYWYPMSIGKPIVAAIQGPCYGVGVQQALCCDLRFAASDAQFAVPYARRGLIAEVGISWLLTRIVGVSNTLDLLMSGRAIDAVQALEMGLVSKVLEPAELFQRAFEYCASLAAESSPWSMRMLKQQVYHDLMTACLSPAFARSEELLKQAMVGTDFVEGVAAFRDRRAPVFPFLPPALAKLDPWPGD